MATFPLLPNRFFGAIMKMVLKSLEIQGCKASTGYTVSKNEAWALKRAQVLDCMVGKVALSVPCWIWDAGCYGPQLWFTHAGWAYCERTAVPALARTNPNTHATHAYEL